MGKWSQWEFGRDQLPLRAFIFGGNTSRAIIDRVIGSYDRILFHKHDNYEPYLVKTAGQETLLAFQVYGAPMVADLLKLLRDGRLRRAIFLGAAYGIAPQLRVADCILPTRVRCLDGFCGAVGAPDWVAPDPAAYASLASALDRVGESFIEGPTASVPSTFFHGDASLVPADALALEIETAAFLHAAAVIGIQCAAALVVSDTTTHSLRDDRSSRDDRLLRIFMGIRDL